MLNARKSNDDAITQMFKVYKKKTIFKNFLTKLRVLRILFYAKIIRIKFIF